MSQGSSENEFPTAALVEGDAIRSRAAAFRASGQYDQAISCLQDLAASQPSNLAALCDLAAILRQSGRLDEAANVCRMALRQNPVDPSLLCVFGAVLYDQGDCAGAAGQFLQAVKADPSLEVAHRNLGAALLDLDRPQQALVCDLRALSLGDGWEARILFHDCVRRLQFTAYNDEVAGHLSHALTEPWCRPEDLTATAAQLLKADPVVGPLITRVCRDRLRRWSPAELFGSDGLRLLSSNKLLSALLAAAPVSDLALEWFLTAARRSLCDVAVQDGSAAIGGEALEFVCLLARQAFITEYVFGWMDDEATQARALRDRLASAIAVREDVAPLHIALVASYFPLGDIAGIEALLGRSDNRAMVELLRQQIEEPNEEARLRVSIPQLTRLTGEASDDVRRQYEENPYPRWVKTQIAAEPMPFDVLLRQSVGPTVFRPIEKKEGIDILVAGCGTGRHPIEAARRYFGGRLLAIDLSLSSLAYAKRKTVEMGLDNIEYAQADIMALGDLGRRFDLIEAAGVLHHLADPMAGWRVLVSLLAPAGVMRVALYSRMARRALELRQSFTADKNKERTAEDIRSFRQDLMAEGESPNPLFSVSESYTISGCRDLLFHVQEHRVSIPEIGRFLSENALTFLGFETARQTISDFRRLHPEARSLTDLALWDAYENEHPDVFGGMYQFLVQKAQ